ncbi:MAG TPA: hypothetical protein VGO57_05670 [Verrucomicrobiae bacterium]|jgi:hypothetical protein
MKKFIANFSLILGVVLTLNSFSRTVSAQTTTNAATAFLNAAQASGDSKLDSIAMQLTNKVAALEATTSTNSALQTSLTSILHSLAGGSDSNALTSALNLATTAKLTPSQLDLAKQVGSLTSAYVVQKNFSTLPGAQGDVATIVNSLQTGSLTSAITPLKNVAQNASLTDTQKQLLASVTAKYVPGMSKVTGAVNSAKDALKKFGF